MAKILVVEDSERLSEMLVERLERRGHSVILAIDSGEALASAKASRPDVIVLESQLRGAGEWATARALKFDDQTRDIPIVGLIDNNSEEARALALQNGCDALHGKPIDFGHLIREIDAAAEKSAEGAADLQE